MNINNLPEALKQLALLRREQETQKQSFDSDEELERMFNWETGAEKDRFWNDVYSQRNIEKHNEYAISVIGAVQPNYQIY